MLNVKFLEQKCRSCLWHEAKYGTYYFFTGTFGKAQGTYTYATSASGATYETGKELNETTQIVFHSGLID